MKTVSDRRTFLAAGLAALGASQALPTVLAAAPSDKKPGWQIGCYTRPWDQHEYRVALDEIAKAGFKYAGLMTQSAENGRLVISVKTTPDEATKIGEEAHSRGLTILSVYGGDFGVAKSFAVGVENLRRLIDNCAAARSATLMVGGTGSADLFDNYYKAVAETCDYAAEKKVGIVVKPHGGLNATGPQCRKTIDRVGHRNFTLWYDPGNIFFYSDGKLDPVEDARTVNGLVTGMCIKDFQMSTEDGKIKKDVAITPGTGRVDFPAVMKQLRAGGFTGGPLLIETLARGDLPFILEEARKTRRFVERLTQPVP